MVFGALISWVLTRSPSPVLQKSKLRLLPHQAEPEDSTKFIVLTLISLVAIVGVLLASGVIYCLRHSSHHRLKEKLSGLGGSLGPDAPSAYQVTSAFLKRCFHAGVAGADRWFNSTLAPPPRPAVAGVDILRVLL